MSAPNVAGATHIDWTTGWYADICEEICPRKGPFIVYCGANFGVGAACILWAAMVNYL